MTFWTAFITGGAAFLGAVIAQLLTNKREERRWKRDQERDAALWKREDEHRFTVHKQEIYSDLLAQLSRWLNDIETARYTQKAFPDRRD